MTYLRTAKAKGKRLATRDVVLTHPTGPFAVPFLALDPSSSCVGWAMFDERGRLGTFGKLTVPPRLATSAWERIRRLAGQVSVLVADKRPSVVVCEVSSGKVGRRHGGAGAGLGIYGTGVGVVLGLMLERGKPAAWVPENVWTRGVPKDERARRVALIHPEYTGEGDSGGDMADAIGLGDYWAAVRHTYALAPATEDKP